MPRLSIVVPIYNVEPYLQACLDSLVRFAPAGSEAILVDDGSSDGSGGIARTYAREHGLHLIAQKNRGLSCARNAGVAAARGEYVLFLDSDDWLGAGLDILLERALADELDIAIGNYYTAAPSGALAKNTRILPSDATTGRLWLKRSLAKRRYQASVWFRLYRRAFIEQEGLHFVPALLNEDQLYSVEVLSAAARVACIDVPFYHYRERPGSITRSYDLASCLRRIDSDLHSARAIAAIASRYHDDELERYVIDQTLRPLAASFVQALEATRGDFLPIAERAEQADALQLARHLRVRRPRHVIAWWKLRRSFREYAMWFYERKRARDRKGA